MYLFLEFMQAPYNKSYQLDPSSIMKFDVSRGLKIEVRLMFSKEKKETRSKVLRSYSLQNHKAFTNIKNLL